MQLRLQHPVIRASLWMVGGILCLSTMAVGGRELSHEIGTFEILFIRSAVSLAIISLLLFRSGWGQLATERLGLHLLRNASHLCGQFGWFYAIAFIPLAEVFAIEFTLPVWTVLLAGLFLGEKISRERIIAVVLGIAGVLLILRPGVAAISPGALAILLGAGAYAIGYTVTKKLVVTDSPMCILFYMALMQLVLSAAPAIALWVTPAPALWPWLLLVGLTAMGAHYCLSRALVLADAMVVVPMDFMRLPLIAVVGYLLYGEQVEWLVFAGAALMVIGNLISVRAEHRRPAAAAPG